MGGVDQWTSIHQDLLNQITKRFYSYDEYLQFRFVCKQWNFNLPQNPSGNKVPWLLLPIATAAAKRSSKKPKIYEGTISKLTERRTRIFEEEEIYYLTMPELQYNKICGSCHGWIIIVLIYEGTIQMLNPFTKVSFDLPPISTLPNVIDIHGDKCTFNFENRVGTLDTISMHKMNVWKVITNSAPNNDRYNDFMAVIIYGCGIKLAFYKPNNPRWIKFPTNHRCIVDVIFFQEKIYAVGYDFQIYEFDIKEKLEPILASNCKGNKIYFNDNGLNPSNSNGVWHHDIGIFNLEDGSCKRVPF
ncbi:putative F-box protein At4g22660 [Arachis duranensis]|uniref:F-box protein At4g22660 n=1 Tax=Arachis duranensis TaxID=130453 RepID=A0A6P4DPT5_ARADU|nr:putative F-box protein At4g22660 [Arachis duranensis]